jgi:transposase
VQPYSLDLRQKIIDTYLDDNLSQRQIAKQFRVAYSFVRKLIKQYRETGNMHPKQRVEQTPTKLSTDQLNHLKLIVEANNDATLAELCDLLEQQVGVRISVATMFRMLERLNLTLKKNTAP